ncbi:MAG: hypothetical protein JJE44_13230 [Flavobacteriaceae bacterium]|nr:hypothetical protein [Flavobacteriaceae bacterium]
MADINKIIRVLDLSQSDAREGTLDGIVKFIIYINGDNGIEKNNISKEIIKELTLEIHEQEINDSVERLLDNGLIEKDGKGNFKLTLDESLKFRQESLKISENSDARFNLFKNHIEKIAFEENYAIVENEVNDLWEIFRTFIYDCYLTHGKNIIENLTNVESEYDDDVKFLVKKYLKETKNGNLSKILSKYITIYPEIVDSNILQYLTSLANKTESFYSLGLSQEEYKKVYDEIKFDWIVFVDTNFIYSILNLHNHPENQAAKFLLELGSELGIKFKYTTKTYDELNNRKKDFEKYLEKDLLPSQIKALLNSGKLDMFAESYYEKLLEDRDNTPHPCDIILHSQNSMKEKKLVIYNSKFDALLKNEDFLLDQESSYNSYLEILDEVRGDKGLKRKGQKEPLQVQHDIFLREAILHLRSSNVTSMNNAKYFGVTLDKTLIKFDLNELRKKTVGILIPTFFKPSILLKKLLRQSPLKTKENYLRAFISTISTPAIDENNFSSKIAIRSVKYFHKMGIDNEKLILDCLKDELFLKNFEKREFDESELEEFVESEINKQITIKTQKIEELEGTIEEKSKRLEKVTEYSSITKSENEKLNEKASDLKETLNLYSRELKKLKEQTSKVKIKADAIQLSIYDEQEKINAENKLKEKDKKNTDLINKIIKSRLKNRKIGGVFLALLSIILICIISLIYLFQNESWNFVSSFINSINGMDEARKNITYLLVALILGIIDVPIINMTFKILFSKKAKNEFIKEIMEEFI